MRAIAPIAALLSLASSQAAAAAASATPCLTPREATAVATYAMPSVIAGTAQRCGKELGSDSYLAREGSRLSEKYATRKGGAWPEAKAALLRIGAGNQMVDAVKNLPDSTVQPVIDTLVTSMVVERVPAERCKPIDRALWLLSPLPPESTAELIALSLGLMAQGQNPRLGKFAICKA